MPDFSGIFRIRDIGRDRASGGCLVIADMI